MPRDTPSVRKVRPQRVQVAVFVMTRSYGAVGQMRKNYCVATHDMRMIDT